MRDLMRQVVGVVGSRGSFARQSLTLPRDGALGAGLTSAANRIHELEELGGVVLEEPVAEAALFPFGEVLFGDGAAVEVGREDGFDFRKGVEPRKDGFVRLMVVETEVELFAEGVRETGDFADTSCSVHNILF